MRLHFIAICYGVIVLRFAKLGTVWWRKKIGRQRGRMTVGRFCEKRLWQIEGEIDNGWRRRILKRKKWQAPISLFTLVFIETLEDWIWGEFDLRFNACASHVSVCVLISRYSSWLVVVHLAQVAAWWLAFHCVGYRFYLLLRFKLL